jgi:hypothetical protein
MFPLRELTLARSRNNCAAGSGDGVPFGIFLAIISLLSRVGAGWRSR